MRSPVIGRGIGRFFDRDAAQVIEATDRVDHHAPCATVFTSADASWSIRAFNNPVVGGTFTSFDYHDEPLYHIDRQSY